MKHLGELGYCFGLEIWRDSGKTFLSQGKYVKGLLKRFRMDQCKPAVVPLQQNIKLQSEDGSKEANATLYRQLVGSLIYLTTTRPDLAYAVSVLSQYMSKQLESHWNEAKSVLRYLQETVDYGIIYIDSSDVRLTGFTDSDRAGNIDDCRSITGYAFNIGSEVITWSNTASRQLSVVEDGSGRLSLQQFFLVALCKETTKAKESVEDEEIQVHSILPSCNVYVAVSSL
eukprot:PITA_18481